MFLTGPDGLHIVPLRVGDTGSEFVVMTVAVKTTSQWSNGRPTAVSANSVRSNILSSQLSRMYAGESKPSSSTREVAELIARTAVLVRIQICLPRVGPSFDGQPSVTAPVWYVRDELTGKPCVIINVTGANIRAMLPADSDSVTQFEKLLISNCLMQPRNNAIH